MKRIFLIAILGIFIASNAYPADQWTKTDPAGTESPADIDTLQTANNEALDRLLIGYVKKADLVYATAASITVSAGQVAMPNSAG